MARERDDNGLWRPKRRESYRYPAPQHPRRCGACDGRGWRTVNDLGQPDLYGRRAIECSICRGKGRISNNGKTAANGG